MENTLLDKKIKYYSPDEIADMGLFPWLNNSKSVLAWLQKQVELGKRKKYGIIVRPGANKFGNRYLVKREGIIKIQASFDDGSLFDGR